MSRSRAALFGLLLIAVQSEAAVICRAGSGKLALRETCRKAEQTVDPGEIDVSSLTGPPGAPGAPGARGQFPLAVVDSAGVEIGSVLEVDFLGLSAFVLITNPALTETVRFLVSRTGFVPNRGGGISSVYYTATNCAGVPHVRPASEGLRVGQVYGDSLYYETGDAVSRSVQSSEADTGAPCAGGAMATSRGTCCGNFSTTQIAAPAVRIPLANLGFVPPFRALPR
jgi:hypothetical protein